LLTKETIIIRQETQNDYKFVFEVNNLAFKQTNEAKLVEALRTNTNVFVPQLSIVATSNNNIVGHILFTKIKIKTHENFEHESLALAPMAVLPKHQGIGIGSKLVMYGLHEAKNVGFKSVIVLGHSNYYSKFGFKPASLWNIKAPFEVPDSAFMAIELQNNSLKNCSGKVVYPNEFNEV